MVEIFDVFHIANYALMNSTLNVQVGHPNGTGPGQNPTRLGLGSRSFAPGIPRTFQFGFRVTW